MIADPDPQPPTRPPPFGLPAMSVRTRGIVGMIIGALLIAIIVPIAYFTVPLMFGWGDPGSGASWSGTRTQSIVVLFIYALVAATGASAMLAGYAYYATGKSPRLLSPAVPVLRHRPAGRRRSSESPSWSWVIIPDAQHQPVMKPS